MTKNIIITGKNSYVGQSLINYCKLKNYDFEFKEVDTKGEKWKTIDFSWADVVINVAGIAHIKETKENEKLYYNVNLDLANDILKKVIDYDVSHYIFLSTMSVYGLVEGEIDNNTVEKPANAYGKSKLLAEKFIQKFKHTNTKLTILRPPMIYGLGSKGNYQTLSKFAKKHKYFINSNNERSMLHIDNLSEFLTQVINHQLEGVLFPQNNQFVNTSEMVREIAQLNDNKLKILNLGRLPQFLPVKLFKKVFGTLKYNQSMSRIFDNFGNEINYNVWDFKESIEVTERV